VPGKENIARIGRPSPVKRKVKRKKERSEKRNLESFHWK
jgi:hypothetical protein